MQSNISCITDMRLCCSLSEADLWDYIITNDTMESTGKQLDDISGRALAGQIGNGIAELQEPELTTSLPAQTVMTSRLVTGNCSIACSRVCTMADRLHSICPRHS